MQRNEGELGEKIFTEQKMEKKNENTFFPLWGVNWECAWIVEPRTDLESAGTITVDDSFVSLLSQDEFQDVSNCRESH